MQDNKCNQINCYQDNISEHQKDKEILNIIKEVIDGVENTDQFIERFNKIYQSEYRHKYSQILECLIEIQDESLDYLVSNMDILKEHIFNKSYNFKKSFLKLYDHVMLEVTRIRLYRRYEERENLIEDKINTAKNQFEYYENVYNNLNTDISNLYATVNNVNEQLQNSNAQFISILGIFSGIVIAFFGSIKVTENIFSNLGKDISKYRIIFMAALVGFILFNTIFILLYFIAKISNKNIATNSLDKFYNKCYKWDEEEGQWKENKKAIKKYRRILDWPLKRLRIRYPIVFWVNLFIISIILMLFTLWIIQNYNIIFRY